MTQIFKSVYKSFVFIILKIKKKTAYIHQSKMIFYIPKLWGEGDRTRMSKTQPRAQRGLTQSFF